MIALFVTILAWIALTIMGLRIIQTIRVYLALNTWEQNAITRVNLDVEIVVTIISVVWLGVYYFT